MKWEMGNGVGEDSVRAKAEDAGTCESWRLRGAGWVFRVRDAKLLGVYMEQRLLSPDELLTKHCKQCPGMTYVVVQDT